MRNWFQRSVLVLMPALAFSAPVWADSVQPIVPSSGVVFGSPQKTLTTDTSNFRYNDPTNTLVITSVTTQGINASGGQVTNLGTPVNASDAATKSYVDTSTGTSPLSLLSSTNTWSAQQTFQRQITISSNVIVTGGSFQGSGTGLSSIPAAQLTGTVPNASIDGSSITKQGNAFNGTSQLVQTTGAGALPALSGVNITAINAGNIASGTLGNARLDGSSVTLRGNTFNGTSQLVLTTSGGALPGLSGANLVTLNASNITSGSLPNARLDASSVTKQGNSFNGTSQLVQTTGSGLLPALSGNNLTNLNAANLTGVVPNASINSSSITKQGNTFNGASQLVKVNGSSQLPVLSGVNLTNLNASALASGTASTSVVTGAYPGITGLGTQVQNLAMGGFRVTGSTTTTADAATTLATKGYVDASTATLGTNLNASNLTTGTIPNARQDSSSVTLQGNTFNAANKLVQLTGAGALPAVSATNLTSIPAANLTGTASINTTGTASTITNVILSSQIAAGSLPSTVIASSLAVNSVTPTAVTSTTYTMSITGNAGSATNGVVTTGSYADPSWITSLAGSKVTGAISGAASTISGVITSTQISAGALPSTVIASSIAVSGVTNPSIVSMDASKLTGTIANARLDSSSVTLQGNTFNTGNSLVQLTSSLVPNSLIDASSITKQGNTFNGASQLVQMNGSTQLPAVSGVNLTNLNASNLASGTVGNARLDASSVTLQANTFNGNSQLVQTTAAGKYPALDGSLITGLSGVATTSTNTWSAMQTFSSATVNLAHVSTITASGQIYASSGALIGMNHRIVTTEAGNRWYTDIGTDPVNDPHIFQTWESWSGNNSSNWVVGNSSNGYAVVWARAYGSANNANAAKLFAAGSGATNTWVTGVNIANSNGLIMNSSTGSIVDATSSTMTFMTECPGCNFTFNPGQSQSVVISSVGIQFPDNNVQTGAFGYSGSKQIIKTILANNLVATSGSVQVPEDDTIPQITEGVEFLSSTFTAVSATSSLLINAVMPLSVQNAGSVACSAYRTGTANALGTTFMRFTAGSGNTIALQVQTGSVSGSQNITIRCGNSASGTIQLNSANASGREYGGASIAAMNIQEVL